MLKEEIKLFGVFRQIWTEQTAFQQVQTLSGQLFRQIKNRRTFKISIQNSGYFVKYHCGCGWKEIIKNLFQFKLPVLGARNEYNALILLNQKGVATMNIAAFGERMGLNPAQVESFIITDELPNRINLEDFSKKWRDTPPDDQLRHIIIKLLAESVGTMHNAGINHRDCYLCHYLLPVNASECRDFRLEVIDLHRAQCRNVVPYRYLVKDLAGLLFSSYNSGLRKVDILRFIHFYRRYNNQKKIVYDVELFRRIKRKADKLYLRIYHCLPPDMNL